VVLMLFCLAMLAGGVLSPMLEVEVRVTKIDAPARHAYRVSRPVTLLPQQDGV